MWLDVLKLHEMLKCARRDADSRGQASLNSDKMERRKKERRWKVEGGRSSRRAFLLFWNMAKIPGGWSREKLHSDSPRIMSE